MVQGRLGGRRPSRVDPGRACTSHRLLRRPHRHRRWLEGGGGVASPRCGRLEPRQARHRDSRRPCRRGGRRSRRGASSEVRVRGRPRRGGLGTTPGGGGGCRKRASPRGQQAWRVYLCVRGSRLSCDLHPIACRSLRAGVRRAIARGPRVVVDDCGGRGRWQLRVQRGLVARCESRGRADNEDLVLACEGSRRGDVLWRGRRKGLAAGRVKLAEAPWRGRGIGPLGHRCRSRTRSRIRRRWRGFGVPQIVTAGLTLVALAGWLPITARPNS